MRMRIMQYQPPFHYMHVHGLCMLCVVCRCFDMQSKSPAPECNVSLVGSHQARVTVNSGSTVTQPTVSPGLGRGVVITPLSACQTSSITKSTTDFCQSGKTHEYNCTKATDKGRVQV